MLEQPLAKAGAAANSARQCHALRCQSTATAHRADLAAQHLVELVVGQPPAAVDVEGVEGLLDPLIPLRRFLWGTI